MMKFLQSINGFTFQKAHINHDSHMKDLIKRQNVQQMQEARDKCIEAVMSSTLIRRGEAFTTSEVADIVRMDKKRASRLMRHMEEKRLIVIKKDKRGCIYGMARQINWLTVKWRKSIPPMIYGSPTWRVS